MSSLSEVRKGIALAPASCACLRYICTTKLSPPGSTCCLLCVHARGCECVLSSNCLHTLSSPVDDATLRKRLSPWLRRTSRQSTSQPLRSWRPSFRRISRSQQYPAKHDASPLLILLVRVTRGRCRDVRNNYLGSCMFAFAFARPPDCAFFSTTSKLCGKECVSRPSTMKSSSDQARKLKVDLLMAHGHALSHSARCASPLL